MKGKMGYKGISREYLGNKPSLSQPFWTQLCSFYFIFPPQLINGTRFAMFTIYYATSRRENTGWLQARRSVMRMPVRQLVATCCGSASTGRLPLPRLAGLATACSGELQPTSGFPIPDARDVAIESEALQSSAPLLGPISPWRTPRSSEVEQIPMP